jgi:hypothetical protein
MRRELAVVVLVLAVGYSMYGALLAAGVAVGDQSPGGDRTDGRSSDGDTAVSSGEEPPFRFREVSTAAGFEYAYRSTFRANQAMISNAGVFAADYDGDGWTDVLAIGGDRPVLFENQAGEFRRSGALPDVDGTVRSGLFFDADGDGDPELLLLVNDRPPVLLDWRDGRYVVVDAGFEHSLAEPVGATTADFDGDGCLDLFVVQYGNWSAEYPAGSDDYEAPFDDDTGNPNQLYDGNCSTFTRSTDAGTRGARWSLATSAADIDNDGDMDIHVANDFNYDVVYRNRGDGTFERVRLGERTNRNGMSSELADVNGDGRLDFFVTNIYYPDYVATELNDVLTVKAEGNNLLVNRGNATFDERADELGVYVGGWGWAAALTDFDNDGDQDLFHATRELDWDSRSRLPRDVRAYASDLAYYSRPVVWAYHDGNFTSVSGSAAGFEAANGRGVARLDYDRDGSMDLLVATTDSYRLYRNVGSTGNALQVRVRDDSGGRAVGARVYLRTGGAATQWRSVRGFTDFLSRDSGIVHFGTRDIDTVALRVVWPDGTERFLEGVGTGQRITVRPSGIVTRRALAANATGETGERSVGQLP